jgi:hypothetical protein
MQGVPDPWQAVDLPEPGQPADPHPTHPPTHPHHTATAAGSARISTAWPCSEPSRTGPGRRPQRRFKSKSLPGRGRRWMRLTNDGWRGRGEEFSHEVTVTSATMRPASGVGGRHAEGQGSGLVLFASVLLIIVGCFNLIYGIAAVANAHVFTADAHYVFGSLNSWGWIALIIGVLQPQPPLAKVLRISRLDQRLPVFATIGDALAHLAAMASA